MNDFVLSLVLAGFVALMLTSIVAYLVGTNREREEAMRHMRLLRELDRYECEES